MYDKRIKISIAFIAVMLLGCLLRLAHIQLWSGLIYRGKIEELRLQQGRSRQFKTIRGNITDRAARVLATDESKLYLCINYKLAVYLDDRIKEAKLLKASSRGASMSKLAKISQQWDIGFDQLQQVIDKCTGFGAGREDIEQKIRKINDAMWKLRTFVAWSRKTPSEELLAKYGNNVNNVPFSEAAADFEDKIKSKDQRLLLIGDVDDIADMYRSIPAVELETDDDVFAAQLRFMDVDGVEISPKWHRVYPYKSAAAQTIGWVSVPQPSDKQSVAGDRLASYLAGEVSGRDDGVEYVCEEILRGRRGEVVYDIDKQQVRRVETQFGKDVKLTLDIELQKRIEDRISDCELNARCKSPAAAVVIEVASGDILSLVSVPVFDLNSIRDDYEKIAGDNAGKPLLNSALNSQYPPGSSVKPLILIAGLETGQITPEAIISCPAHAASNGWPNCWIYNKYNLMGHDDKWPNSARNAVKGSCNIYFSHLADRIPADMLQRWLFDFGYGRMILSGPAAAAGEGRSQRSFRQAQGQITDTVTGGVVTGFEQLPVLSNGEKRFFGIGQGNLRVTPLQVANAIAAVARGGIYRPPRLFIEPADSNEPDPVYLNISRRTLDTVRDGMSAVVNEDGGTAYQEFVNTGFAGETVKVYGKTGSTENPEHAWFAGFAEDYRARSVAVAVVVEGGQHGSSDAGPIARDIIQFCIESGYIGRQKTQDR